MQERLFQIHGVEDFGKSKELVSSQSRDEATPTWSIARRAVKAQNLAQLSLCPTVTQPIIDRATNLFFGTHVIENPNMMWGIFAYLPAAFRGTASDIKGNKALCAAVHAVSIAAYAATFQSSSLLNQAHLRVGLALRLVNDALASPEEALADSMYPALS